MLVVLSRNTVHTYSFYLFLTYSLRWFLSFIRYYGHGKNSSHQTIRSAARLVSGGSSHNAIYLMRRLSRYVAGSQQLMEEGYIPVTQAHPVSGRFLAKGAPDITALVELRVRKELRDEIREVYGPEAEIHIASGSVIPLYEPRMVQRSSHITASRRGLTAFVRVPQKNLSKEETTFPVHAMHSLGSAMAIPVRRIVPASVAFA